MKRDPKRKYQIVDTASEKNTPATVRLILDAALKLVRHPLRFLTQLNVRNIKILASALKYEPIGLVLRNFIRLLEKPDGEPDQLRLHSTLEEQYQQMLRAQMYSPEDLEKLYLTSLEFAYQPLISIVIPIFKPDLGELNACLQSIEKQVYKNWEVQIYDDASNDSDLNRFLNEWVSRDDRFQICIGKDHMHISLASNQAIRNCSGDYVIFVDQDDLLTEDALYRIVEALNGNSQIDVLYSDHDKISQKGRLVHPYFKSDFNPDLLLCHNYFGHLLVVRRSLGEDIGWFREGFEGAQDYDLILRSVHKTNRIYHLPRVLYHWRQSKQSTAYTIDSKPYALEASRRALEEYLNVCGIEATVESAGPPNTFRVKRKVSREDQVSIIIPFKDEPDLLLRCVQSIQKLDHYQKFEVLLISNNSELPATYDLIDRITGADTRFRFYRYDVPFNYSQINNWAVQKANGSLLLFLNNDTEALNDEWLSALVEHVSRKEVGAVGSKLIYPDRTIQHAGVIIGIGGTAAHAFKNFPLENSGYYGRADLQQNLSAVTGACMMVRKSLFEQLGGFDEKNLKISFSDIDLCLRIREAGYLIVYTPYSLLIHHESKSRGTDPLVPGSRAYEEVRYFQQRWKEILSNGDPYYNPNLSITRTDFSLRLDESK